MIEDDPIPDSLIQRIGSGDESALAELQTITRKRLANYVWRIVRDHQDTEEVLQDVYTYVWLHAHEYRGDRGTPKSWIYMLARSRAVDRLRKLRRERAQMEFSEEVGGGTTCGLAVASSEMWNSSQLRRGVPKLPRNQQELIRMAFLYGFTQVEISDRTGVPLGTVKSRVRTAIAALRRKILAEDLLLRAA